MHAGTHADSPAHVEEEYPTIDKVPIEKYVGKGVVVDIPKGKWGIIGPEDLEKAEPSIERNDIVIIHTGWHRFYGDTVKYFVYAPGLYKEAGEWLLKKRVKAVGVDQQALEHPLGTRIVQPPPILPWVIDEYKQVTGHDVYKDFPYWEPAHRLMLTNGIVGLGERRRGHRQGPGEEVRHYGNPHQVDWRGWHQRQDGRRNREEVTTPCLQQTVNPQSVNLHVEVSLGFALRVRSLA